MNTPDLQEGQSYGSRRVAGGGGGLFSHHLHLGGESCQCSQQPQATSTPSYHGTGHGRHEESPTLGSSSPRSYVTRLLLKAQ